jgi:hypothetical protein
MQHTDRVTPNVDSVSSSSQFDRRTVILGAGKVAAAGVAATLGALGTGEARAHGVAVQ